MPTTMSADEEYDAAFDTWVERIVGAAQRGEPLPWAKFPQARIHRLWSKFIETGLVLDEDSLAALCDHMVSVVARIDANTILSAHTHLDPVVFVSDRLGVTLTEAQWEYIWWTLVYDGRNDAISDYGLRPLRDLVSELQDAASPEERLVIIDRMLAVTHVRGNLAALFIDGGREALDRLGKE